MHAHLCHYDVVESHLEWQSLVAVHPNLGVGLAILVECYQATVKRCQMALLAVGRQRHAMLLGKKRREIDGVVHSPK